MSENAEAVKLLSSLRSLDVGTRLAAVRGLARIVPSAANIVESLEKVALNDADLSVRRAALEALSMPAHQTHYWQRMQTVQMDSYSPADWLRNELDNWAGTGLIRSDVARVLKQRYPLEEPPEAVAQEPEPAPVEAEAAVLQVEAVPEAAEAPPEAYSERAYAPPQPAPTLSQILLSETAIKIALYLGAFFVVVAAFIIAALFEVARMPILGAATLGLFGGSFVLSRRLPLAAFVLYAAGSLMIPIDAGVLASLLDLKEPALSLLWTVTYAGLSAVWALGTWTMRSRLFGVLTSIGLGISVYNLGQYLNLDPQLLIILLQLIALLTLAGAWQLRRMEERFFWPLFLTAQAELGLLVLASTVTGLSSIGTMAPSAWLLISGVWFLATVFYVASDSLVGRQVLNLSPLADSFQTTVFSPLAVLCLLVIPLVGLQATTPTLLVFSNVAFGWGLLIAIAGEAVIMLRRDDFHAYGMYLLTGSIPLIMMSVLTAFESTEFQIGYLAGAAILFTVTSIRKIRWPLWTLALAGWTVAYLLVFSLPVVDALKIFFGIIAFVPMAVYLSLDLAGRKWLSLGSQWTMPLLLFGAGFTLITAIAAFFAMFFEPGNAAITFLLMAVFLIAYAILGSRFVWPEWSAALTALTMAYFSIFSVEPLRDLELFVGYILLVPMVVYLTVDLIGRKRLGLELGWTVPPLILGSLFTLATCAATLISLLDRPGDVAITYLVVAVYLTVYSIIDRRVIFWFGALATAYVAYFAMLQIEAIQQLNLFEGLAYLPPVIIYLVIYRVARRTLNLGQWWWLPSLLVAGVAGAIDLLMGLANSSGQPEYLALTFLLWAIVLGIFTVIESERIWWWSGTLVMAYASYSVGIAIPALEPLNLFGGYVHAAAAILLLSAGLLARRGFGATMEWTFPPAVIGGVAVLIASVITVLGSGDIPERGLIVFSVFAVYSAIYAVIDGDRLIPYISVVTGLVAYTYFLFSLRQPSPDWAAPFILLGVAYYVISLVSQIPLLRVGLLTQPFRVSGLVLASFASLIAFFQAGWIGMLGIALAATIYAIEAFRTRNVWLGYPTNLLYMLSYFMALRGVGQSDPQFFAIGAALLGLIMHYLLTRNGNKGAAFITGLLSQLMLQSVSYFQMLTTSSLIYFAVLFFESLVIAVYGLVIRSRGLLFIPIGFLVLGSVTVAFTFLQTWSTAAIIGITGVVLLGLGILALVMRERLIRLVEVLNTWEP